MGRVAEVRYDTLIKETDHGYLLQFGELVLWIHEGRIYNHDWKRRALVLPESFILEKLLDPFKICEFARREKITVNKVRFKLLEVSGGHGKAQCLECSTVFEFAAPTKNCMMVQRYEVVPVCPGCGAVPQHLEKEKDDAKGDKQ